jgi:hypothetical protein
VFLLERHKTTIRELCRLGFITVVRYSDGPYAVIMRQPDFFVHVPISDADFETLEEEIRSGLLKRVPEREASLDGKRSLCVESSLCDRAAKFSFTHR